MYGKSNMETYITTTAVTSVVSDSGRTHPWDSPGNNTVVGCHFLLQETYITICKIGSQWEFSVWLRKLKQGLCINLQGWDGEGDRKEVQKGKDICIPMAGSC